MEIQALLLDGLRSLLTNTPLIIVGVVGIIIALTQLNKKPQRARLTLFAFILLLFVTIVSAFTLTSLPVLLYEAYGGPPIQPVMTVIGIILNLLRATAWILILIAIFGKEKVVVNVPTPEALPPSAS